MHDDDLLPLPARMHRPGADGPLGGRPYTRQFQGFLQQRLPYDLRHAPETEGSAALYEYPANPPRRRKPLSVEDWDEIPYVYNRLREQPELRELDPDWRVSLKLRAISLKKQQRLHNWQIARLFHCSPKQVQRWKDLILELVRRFYIPEE